jgi:hypothetical protein
LTCAQLVFNRIPKEPDQVRERADFCRIRLVLSIHFIFAQEVEHMLDVGFIHGVNELDLMLPKVVFSVEFWLGLLLLDVFLPAL